MRRGWVEEHRDRVRDRICAELCPTRVRPGTMVERGTARGLVRDEREAAAAAELMGTPRGPKTTGEAGLASTARFGRGHQPAILEVALHLQRKRSPADRSRFEHDIREECQQQIGHHRIPPLRVQDLVVHPQGTDSV